MESLKELFKIGPGPSSSHTMGPQKACIYVLNNFKEANNFLVTLFGSLALTGKGHLTDKIIENTLGKSRTKVIFDIKRKKLPHPNYFVIQTYKDKKLISKTNFISIGGGNIIINGKEPENNNVYPFKNFNEIKEYSIKNNMTLHQIVYKFDTEDIKEYLNKIYDVMIESIDRGLKNTGVLPGILHLQRKASFLNKPNKENEDDENKHIRVVSSYAYAVSEENAAGGTIVTAPTCGSCGVQLFIIYKIDTT
jgi:L-serine dehydratase